MPRLWRSYPKRSPENATKVCDGGGEAGGCDHFERLPDSLLLLIFQKITHLKTLGCCCTVSRRFRAISVQAEEIVVQVDCVTTEDSVSDRDTPRAPLRNPFRLILRAMGECAGPPKDDEEDGVVTRHTPAEVLSNFNQIRVLRIVLPEGELSLDDGTFLIWRADFGSTLDNFVILGATSVFYSPRACPWTQNCVNGDENANISPSFFEDGSLKQRVVWTISSLIAASSRHYLVQPLVNDHPTLDSFILADEDGQGVLRMNRRQMEECRLKPPSAVSPTVKRGVLPDLDMKIRYEDRFELSNGVVWKGATMVAAVRRDQSATGGTAKKLPDISWVSSAFEDPYRTAAITLLKRPPYNLEMSSF